jgi:hypothetical protein
MDVITTEYHTGPDRVGYRILIVRDTDASSPREDSNVTTMHTFDRDYISPDGALCQDRHHRQVHPIIPSEYVEDGRVDMRRARRWVNLFGRASGILAFAGLDHERGGVYAGTLGVTDDDETIGYIAVTRQGWQECMGDESPLSGDEFTPSAARVMQSEVEAYNRWASGEYVGFIVQRQVRWVRQDAIDDEGAGYEATDTMTTWEDVEDASIWGIDDEDYALQEARSFLPTGSVPATDPAKAAI